MLTEAKDLALLAHDSYFTADFFASNVVPPLPALKVDAHYHLPLSCNHLKLPISFKPIGSRAFAVAAARIWKWLISVHYPSTCSAINWTIVCSSCLNMLALLC